VLPAVSGQSSGSTYTYTAGYNPDGQVASLGYPAVGGMAAETLTPTYEDTGGSTGLPVSELVQGQSVVDGYTGVDQLASRAYDASSGYVGSTTDRLYGYDSLERLSSVQTIVTQRVSGMPTQVQNDSYSYDNANNITDIVDSTGTNQQTCFNYDGLDRLTKAWTQATATGHCATYDPNAQLSPAGFNQQYTYADDGTPTSRTDLGVVTTFSDGGAVGHPHAIVSAASTAGTNTFAYDADGRQSSRTVGGVTTALSWDPLQHLYKSTTGSASTTYVNSAGGNRIARQDPDGSTTIWLAGDELHVSAGVVTDTRYYGFAGSTVGMKAESGHLTWLLNDGQNSRQVTVDDANGNATRTYYAPYGAQRAGAATLPTDQGFLGRVTDSATGLLQDGARYFDPVLGEFLTPDPLSGSSAALAARPYVYAGDNPIVFSDPSGLIPLADDSKDQRAVTTNWQKSAAAGTAQKETDAARGNLAAAGGVLSVRTLYTVYKLLGQSNADLDNAFRQLTYDGTFLDGNGVGDGTVLDAVVEELKTGTPVLSRTGHLIKLNDIINILRRVLGGAPGEIARHLEDVVDDEMRLAGDPHGFLANSRVADKLNEFMRSVARGDAGTGRIAQSLRANPVDGTTTSTGDVAGDGGSIAADAGSADAAASGDPALDATMATGDDAAVDLAVDEIFLFFEF